LKRRVLALVNQLAPLLAGALAVLAFAPFNLWPLLPVALAVLFYRVLHQRPGPAFGSGLLFGVGYFAAGVHWVYVSCFEFGHMGVVLSALTTLLLVAYLALYPALFGWLVARYWGDSQGQTPGWHAAIYLLGLPGLWIALEQLRGWLFTGFPWISSGYSQVDGPLAGLAPLIGSSGIGWLLAMLAGAGLLVQRRQWRQSVLVLAGIALLFGVARLPAQWTQPVGSPLSVALVQGNVPQLTRWDPDQVMANIGRHLQASEAFWGVDLLVWPENSIPAFAQSLPDGLLPALQQKAAESNTDLLVGMPLGGPVAGHYFNGINLVGGGTGKESAAQQYRKRHLVPFGEYVPLRGLLGGMLDLLQVPMSAFSLGPANQRPLVLNHSGTVVAPSICYEILFASEVMQMLPTAGVVVNISNDAWFGDTIAPHQHLQIARMRALESERPLARATNSGITALIDWRGQVVAQSPQFKQTVLTGTLQPRLGSTPYMVVGDWPLRGLLVLSLGGLFWQRRRQLAAR
jgi:apolipoprotein N-acyltransferase